MDGWMDGWMGMFAQGRAAYIIIEVVDGLVTQLDCVVDSKFELIISTGENRMVKLQQIR